MKKRWIVGVVGFVIIVGAIWHSHGDNHSVSNPKTAVEVVTAKTQPMPLWVTLPGQIQPEQTVSLKPQVTGNVVSISFKDGQSVEKGQLLFQIDPASFSAALAEAKANLVKSQAQLHSDQLDEDRYASLLAGNYISQQQYDQARAATQAQAADVKAKSALVDRAAINLENTRITAPFPGVVGASLVKVGDLVDTDSVLAVLNQMNPLQAVFAIPQQQLASVRSYSAEGPLMVEIWDESLTKELGDGSLVFIDNAVDAQTGTVTLKAEVDNTKGLFWPGESVVVRIVLTVQADALVIPSAALQLAQSGHFVFVVVKGQAVRRPIQISRQQSGLTVVKKGLAVGDRVIVTLPQGFVEGPVQVVGG